MSGSVSQQKENRFCYIFKTKISFWSITFVYQG